MGRQIWVLGMLVCILSPLFAQVTGQGETASAPSVWARGLGQEPPVPDDTLGKKGESQPQENLALDVSPVLKSRRNPVYPEAALKQHIEGFVYIKILVDKEGKPREVSVVKSDNEILNQAALDAARDFTFTPAYVKNAPVDVWITVPFNFRLAKEKPAPVEPQTLSEQLTGLAKSILEGKNIDSVNVAIDPEANIVDGSSLRNLTDALGGPRKPGIFADEHARHVSFLKITFNDQRDSALLLLKTEAHKKSRPHLHSIYFTRSKDGNWKIRQWQTSK